MVDFRGLLVRWCGHPNSGPSTLDFGGANNKVVQSGGLEHPSPYWEQSSQLTNIFQRVETANQYYTVTLLKRDKKDTFAGQLMFK